MCFCQTVLWLAGLACFDSVEEVKSQLIWFFQSVCWHKCWWLVRESSCYENKMEVMLLGRISSCAPSLEAQVILSLIYPRQDNLLLQLLFQIIGQEILSRSDSMEYEVGFWTRSRLSRWSLKYLWCIIYPWDWCKWLTDNDYECYQNVGEIKCKKRTTFFLFWMDINLTYGHIIIKGRFWRMWKA